MNLEEYRQAKRLQEQRDNDTVRRSTCFRCRRKKETCLCDHLKTFSSKTMIALLMHPKEAKKQKIGTGYLSQACLENSIIFSDVNLDENREFQKFLKDPQFHHVLLYPAENALSIDDLSPEDLNALRPKNEISALNESKTLVLHFIDATWPCAKKMMRLSKSLQVMPKVSFKNQYRSQFVIKHQPHEACLSTIETIYYCLEGLKNVGYENQDLPSENLIHALKALVTFQLNCENDPNIPSTRGTKKGKAADLTHSRIREKKNRLFFWDVDKSPIGRS